MYFIAQFESTMVPAIYHTNSEIRTFCVSQSVVDAIRFDNHYIRPRDERS